LQFDAVPRRVADDRIKAAIELVAFPIGPDAGESDLPIQEAFFGD
jgi:hypothetical protein